MEIRVAKTMVLVGGVGIVAAAIVALALKSGEKPCVAQSQSASGTVNQTKQIAAAPRLISSTSLGEAVSAQGKLFWVDSRDGGHSIYGYDPATQKEYLVNNGPNGMLRSDDKTITWLVAPDSEYKVAVDRYDPVSKKQSMIASLQLPAVAASPFEGFPMFAADTNSIYHVGGKKPEDQGLYGIDLATGKERLVTGNAIDPNFNQSPVARDGILVWHEVTYPDRLAHTKLHALNASGVDTILVDSDGCPGFDVSGSRVIWALGCASLDSGIHITDLQTGETKLLSTGVNDFMDDFPLISGRVAAWMAAPEGDQPWSLVSYDIASGSKTTVLTTTEHLIPQAIVGQNAIAYLGMAPSNSSMGLYLVGIK